MSPRFPFRGASIPRGNKIHPLGFIYIPPAHILAARLGSTTRHSSSLVVCLLAIDFPPATAPAVLLVLLASLPFAACANDSSISLDFSTTRGSDIGGKGAHEMPLW